MDFGYVIKKRRENMADINGRYSLENMAAMMRLTERQYSDLEDGSREPSDEEVEKISVLLHLDRSMLYASCGRIPDDVVACYLGSSAPEIVANVISEMSWMNYGQLCMVQDVVRSMGVNMRFASPEVK